MTRFAVILLAFSPLIAGSASASLPDLSSFSALTSENFVGEGGVVILDCHYQGTNVSLLIRGRVIAIVEQGVGRH